MLNDSFVRRAIKNRNKELRQRGLKLSYVRWLVIISLSAIVLLVLSRCTYQCAPWLSGALVSVSCGCFTGLTFFFLANARNNKERKLQKEYLALKQTVDLLMVILGYGDYYKFYKKMWAGKRNALEDGFEILLLLDKLEIARAQIDLSIYDIVTTLGYDPLDQDNLNSYRERLNAPNDAASMETNILWICKELLPVADELQTLLQERDDQITFIGGYFL